MCYDRVRTCLSEASGKFYAHRSTQGISRQFFIKMPQISSEKQDLCGGNYGKLRANRYEPPGNFVKDGRDYE